MMLHAADDGAHAAKTISPVTSCSTESLGVHQVPSGSNCELHRSVAQSVTNMAASLGKHERVVARLRQQLNDSLAAHQQRLMQDLECIIQQAAAKAAAGATAGAAVGAAAGAAAAAALQVHLSAGACFSTSNTAQTLVSPQVLVRELSLQRLQVAAAGAQLLQQQLETAETKLNMHRAAAIAAKHRILQLEALLQQHGQEQPAPYSAAPQHEGGEPEQFDPASHHHQQCQSAQSDRRDPHQQQCSTSSVPGIPSACCTDNLGDYWQISASDSVTANIITVSLEANIPALSLKAHIDDAPVTATTEPAALAREHVELVSGEPAILHKWEVIRSPAEAPGGAHQHALVHSLKHQPMQQHAATGDAAIQPAPDDGQAVNHRPIQSSNQEMPQADFSQQQLVQFQHDAVLHQLHLALTDNTVLCCECMHLQQLLVQERLVGRNACQAVALKLASDIITMRQRLEEVQLDLGVQTLTTEAALLAAAVPGQHSLPSPGQDSQQKAQQPHAVGSGEEQLQLEVTATVQTPALQAHTTPAGYVARYCESVLQLLAEHKEENKALLQELEGRLSTISSVYEDTAWADDIQHQLAAIEQSCSRDYLAVTASSQPEAKQALTAVAMAGAPAQSTGAECRLDQWPETTESAAVARGLPASGSKPKAYVTTPSGHVSVVTSRRGTEVLLPMDTAYWRRSTSVIQAGEGTLIAGESSTSVAETDAVAPAIGSRAQRRSTLSCMTAISEERHQGQQTGRSVASESVMSDSCSLPLGVGLPPGVPGREAPSVEHPEAVCVPATLTVLRAAAKQLSSTTEQRVSGSSGAGSIAFVEAVCELAASVQAHADLLGVGSRAAVESCLSTAMQPVGEPMPDNSHLDRAQMEVSAIANSSLTNGLCGSPGDPQTTAVSLVDALHQAAAGVLTQPPAVTAGQTCDHNKLQQHCSKRVTGQGSSRHDSGCESSLVAPLAATMTVAATHGTSGVLLKGASCGCAREKGEASCSMHCVGVDMSKQQCSEHSMDITELSQRQLAAECRHTQELQQELSQGDQCSTISTSGDCHRCIAVEVDTTVNSSARSGAAKHSAAAVAQAPAEAAKPAESTAGCCSCTELQACKAALAAQHSTCEELREINRYLQLQLLWALEQMQIRSRTWTRSSSSAADEVIGFPSQQESDSVTFSEC